MTRDRPVLLLGGSGFIGHALLRQLCGRGDRVIALAQRWRPDLLENSRITWVYGDLRDTSVIGRLFHEHAGTIIYAAGSQTPAASRRDPAADVEANLAPLIRCLERAVETRVRRFVYISSGGTVYGPSAGPVVEDMPTAPINEYGLLRATAEKYIALMGRDTPLSRIILRVSNVYGPGQMPKPGFGLIPTAILRALEGEPIVLFNGGRDIRDYVYVNDVVTAILRAVDDDRTMSLNIGSGIGASGLDVVTALEDVFGKRLQIRLEPGRAEDVTSIILDIGRARQCLGWRPTVELRPGLAATVAWLSGWRSRESQRGGDEDSVRLSPDAMPRV